MAPQIVAFSFGGSYASDNMHACILRLRQMKTVTRVGEKEKEGEGRRGRKKEREEGEGGNPQPPRVIILIFLYFSSLAACISVLVNSLCILKYTTEQLSHTYCYLVHV